MCRQRCTRAWAHTHKHTHTESFTRSQRPRCGIRETQLQTWLRNPESERKTWTHRDTRSPSYTETRRERQRQHLLERRPAREALTPGHPVTSHSQRLKEVSWRHREARRWPQSSEDAAPRVAGTFSRPSVRGLRVCWRDPSSRPASVPESAGKVLPESEGSGRIKTSGIRGPLTRLRKMEPGPSTHACTGTEARWREAGLQARCCGARPEWGGGRGSAESSAASSTPAPLLPTPMAHLSPLIGQRTLSLSHPPHPPSLPRPLRLGICPKVSPGPRVSISAPPSPTSLPSADPSPRPPAQCLPVFPPLSTLAFFSTSFQPHSLPALSSPFLCCRSPSPPAICF